VKLKSAVYTYLAKNRLPIKPEDRHFRNLWQEHSKSLIVQDLEFIKQTKFGSSKITEICWGWYNKDKHTWEVFHSTINHRLSVQQVYNIYDEGPQRYIIRGALLKIYGQPSERETEGITIHDLADHLETNVAGQEMWLAECFTGYYDYHLLFRTLDEIGKF